jgi:uncharacterized protein YcbX
MDGPAVDHPDALDYHHRWFVVDDKNHQLGQRQAPALADLSLALANGCLVLRAPGMLRLDIVLDVIEDDDSVRTEAWVSARAVDVVDEGDLVAAWFSNLLEQQCRLVKVHPDAMPPD